MVGSHSVLLDLSAAFDLVFHSVLLEFFFFVFLAALGLRYCAGCLVAASRGYSLQCVGFLLQWLLLLQSTGSRHSGFGAGTQGLGS